MSTAVRSMEYLLHVFFSSLLSNVAQLCCNSHRHYVAKIESNRWRQQQQQGGLHGIQRCISLSSNVSDRVLEFRGTFPLALPLPRTVALHVVSLLQWW